MLELETMQKQSVSHWSLKNDDAYQAWRNKKLKNVKNSLDLPPVRLGALENPTESERRELEKRCKDANLAIYETPETTQITEGDSGQIRAALLAFSNNLGLRIAERHRSAGDFGIVALHVTDAARQRGYIPYSRRAMNWHTDGYYNAPDQQILAMVLHCVRPAEDGGSNQFMDPEVAYIRLRDENPAYIRALMAPDAMTIPENREPDGTVRATSIGPVFSIDKGGNLAMRYTARTRSIQWRDDAVTGRASRALIDILTGDDALIITARLKAGQGILCNNVLHNRTGFDPETAKPSNRMLYRIRFHNRIETKTATGN